MSGSDGATEKKQTDVRKASEQIDLVCGVSVCPLLFQPIGELLVWLVVCRDVEDGGR